MNASTTPAEQEERSEQAQHNDLLARVLNVAGRHIELILMVAFGALVLIALGIALANRSGGTAPSTPARGSSTQSVPASPPAAAPPVPTTTMVPAPRSAPSAANPTPAPMPAPTPRPAPIPRPAPAPGPVTEHTVVAGDTLSAIGLRYQVGYEQIAAANGVADPYRLRPGQRLRIPERAPDTIVIAPGDTLSGHALGAGVSVAELIALNPRITDPNRIFAGGQLRLPPATARGSASDSVTAPAPHPRRN